MARQAIYNKRGNVEAYELLFRNSNENFFSPDTNEENATIKLLSNCNTIGLDKLTNNKKAFINFPKGILLKDMITLLSEKNIVVEILENVEAIDEIILYLKELKSKGYILALDDVISGERCLEFGDLIDIYKIDFMATTKKERESILSVIKYINPKSTLLAEKIETDDDYEEAVKNNYSYFQGYYFSKPVMISAKDISVRNINCFNIMVELLNPEFNIDVVENIIKSDLAISYKLIKFLNSSKFGFVQEITSIRQAIMMIGTTELKKWLSLIAISEMQNNVNEEITNSTIIKARFCELIAQEIDDNRSSSAFIIGLFSNLDHFINKDMEDIMQDIHLGEEVKKALLGDENTLGDILRLVRAYERVDMEEVNKLCEKLNYDKKMLINQYLESIKWLDKFIS